MTSLKNLTRIRPQRVLKVIHEYHKYLTKEFGEGEFITEEHLCNLMLIVNLLIFHNNFNGYLSFIFFRANQV